MKFFAVFVVSAITGYFVYPLINPPDQYTQLPQEKKEKFQDLLGSEVKVYAESQDVEQKLKAAEEMYGKMMLLMLAELGLRSNHEFKSVTKSESTVPEKCEPLVIEKSVCPESLLHSKSLVGKISEKEAVIKKPQDKEKEEWVKYATTPFMDELKGNVKKLIGRLEGTLTHEGEPDEGRIDTLIMQFNFYQEEKSVSGNYEVTMTDSSGKTYSRNSGDGGNRTIKAISDSPEAFFIEASPTSYFLLNLKSFPIVNGVYFDKGKRIGTVVLRKL